MLAIRWMTGAQVPSIPELCPSASQLNLRSASNNCFMHLKDRILLDVDCLHDAPKF